MNIDQVHGVTFKKRAPRAIKEIKKFAYQAMVRPSPSVHIYEVEIFEAAQRGPWRADEEDRAQITDGASS